MLMLMTPLLTCCILPIVVVIQRVVLLIWRPCNTGGFWRWASFLKGVFLVYTLTNFAKQLVFAFHLLSSSPLYNCDQHSFSLLLSYRDSKNFPLSLFVHPQIRLLHRNKRLVLTKRKCIQVKVAWFEVLNSYQESGPWRIPNLIFDKSFCCGSLNQKIARCLHFCPVNCSIGQQQTPRSSSSSKSSL